MKTTPSLLLLILFALASCSIDSDDRENLTEPEINIEWHLTNISGGISGINNQFDLETIIWSFDAKNNELKVINNNTNDALEDGLDSGTYNYKIFEDVNDDYLIINEEEYGKFTYSEDKEEITIDQNQNSSTTLSDLYILKLSRKLIATDVLIN